MASFTETATLKVVDESSAQIKAINRALKALFKTAGQLKSASASIDIKTKGLAQANAMVKTLARDVKGLKAGGSIPFKVTGLSAAQGQINRLRSQAQRPITARVAATVQRGAAGLARGAAAGTVNLSASSLHSFTYALGRAIVDATKKGVNDSDIGDTSLRLKQLDRTIYPGAEAQAQSMIRQQQLQKGLPVEKGGLQGGAFYNLGQRTKAFSEAYGVTRDLASAKFLTGQMEELTRLAVAQGRTFNDAQQDAVNYGKALEAMGRLTNKVTGEFDQEKATKSFEFLNKLAPSIGEEFTGSFVRSISKYLASSKYAISDKGFGAVLMLGEEIGTRAAVGYNQAVKQFSGQGLTKTNKAAQIASGLLIEDKETYVDKRGRTRTRTKGLKAVNQHLLDTDLPAWIAQEAVPRMMDEVRNRTKGTKAQKEAAAQAAATDPEIIKEFSRKWLGERTAQEAFGSFAYRSKEQQDALREAEARKGDTATMRELTSKSIRATTQGLQNQFQGVMGEAVMTMAPTLTKGMSKMSDEMSQLAVDVDTGKVDTGEAMVKAGVLAASGALVTGLMASMSKDPATAALGGAALALDGSAAALTAAAVALGGKGVIPDMPGGAPDKPGGGKPTDPKKGGGWQRKAVESGKGVVDKLVRYGIPIVTTAATVGGRFAGPIAAGAALAYGAYTYPEPDADKQQQIQQMRELQQAKIDLAQTDRQLSMAERALASINNKKKEEEYRREIARLKEKKAAQQAAIETALGKQPAIAVPSKPEWLDNAAQLIRDMQKAPEKPQWAIDAERRERETREAKPFPAPLPGEKPTDKADTGEIQNAANTLMTSTSSFTSAIGSLSETSSSFSTVFATGAQQIGSSGQVAASALQGAAPGIGATIGNAAAAAIQAAVANINVNVNANVTGGGGDKGNINHANGNK